MRNVFTSLLVYFIAVVCLFYFDDWTIEGKVLILIGGMLVAWISSMYNFFK